MPYEIIEKDNKYQVVKEDGQLMGEHGSKEKAAAQVRALYASEGKSAKFGNSNNQEDQRRIQALHDTACELGAACAEKRIETLSKAYIKSIGRSPDLWQQTAVKRVGADEIKGYIALWGDPENVDLDREYFTAKTDFWDDKLSFPRPLTWDHQQDPSMKASPVIGQITEFGNDELGKWYSAQLSKVHEYRKMIDQLLEEGMLGTSSDSAPQYVVREKQKNGSIWLRQWALFAGALTPTPCEPRMLGSVEFWKSINVALPDAPEDQVRDMKRMTDLFRLSL